MLRQLEKSYKTTLILGLGSISKHVRERYVKHPIASEGEITHRKVSLNNQKRKVRSFNVRITPMAHKGCLCRGKQNKLLLFWVLKDTVSLQQGLLMLKDRDIFPNDIKQNVLPV